MFHPKEFQSRGFTFVKLLLFLLKKISQPNFTKTCMTASAHSLIHLILGLELPANEVDLLIQDSFNPF